MGARSLSKPGCRTVSKIFQHFSLDTMTSVIVVDNDLAGCLREYGQIIDSVNESARFSESLQTFIKPYTNEIINTSELKTKVVESSSPQNLARLSDKEFEPAFNLVVYILLQLEGSIEKVVGGDSQVVQNLLDCNPKQAPSLRDRKSIKSTSILSVLNTIFNFIPETSRTRITLLEKILYIYENSSLDFLLMEAAIGDNLVQWLAKTGASSDEIKALFWKFITLDKKASLGSLQLIKKFTSQYTLNLEQLQTLIKFALVSEVVDVSFLVNNNVAQAIRANSSDSVVQSFVDYTSGKLLTTVPSGLPVEPIVQKSKILVLAKFLIDNDDKLVFNYSDFPSTLSESPEQFEMLVVNSLKAGVIDGRLSQSDQKFYLTRVNRLILAGHDNSKNWDAVRTVLNQWKNALENIDEIVNASRESIVNNNNA